MKRVKIVMPDRGGKRKSSLRESKGTQSTSSPRDLRIKKGTYLKSKLIRVFELLKRFVINQNAKVKSGNKIQKLGDDT